MKILTISLALAVITLFIAGVGYLMKIDECDAIKASRDSSQTQLVQKTKTLDSLKAIHKNCFPMSDLLEPLEKNHVVLTKKEYNNLMSQVARFVPRPMSREEREEKWAK